jgi:hypothetical protein
MLLSKIGSIEAALGVGEPKRCPQKALTTQTKDWVGRRARVRVLGEIRGRPLKIQARFGGFSTPQCRFGKVQDQKVQKVQEDRLYYLTSAGPKECV